MTGRPSAPVRIGLVGYGLGGSTFHAPFIAADARLALTAVVTADPARAAAARTRYPGARICSTVVELLDHADEMDLVVVSTPNATHVPVARAVIAAGRPVVVDKPVAPTAAEVRQLAGLAATHNVAVIPFHNRRWDSDFLTVRRVLSGGALGRVHRVESRYERWQPHPPTGSTRAWKRQRAPGAGTGILYDLGTHLIDQAVVLFGRPAAVYAEVATRRGSGVDDDVFVALDFADGPAVHLWASAVAAQLGPRFRVLGGDAAFVIFGMDVQEQDLNAGDTPARPGWGESPASAWGHVTTGDRAEPVPTVAGNYGQFYAGLAAWVLDGAAPPVGIADAVAVAEVTEAALLSAGERRVVELDADSRAPTESPSTAKPFEKR